MPTEPQTNSGDDLMLAQRYLDAVTFAADVHRRDIRKGTEIPYLAHILAVSAMVLEDEGSEDEAIAGLLHDCAEDHGGEEMLARIGREFGDEVAEIVAGCSDSLLEEGALKEAWRPRKERYIAHFETATPGVLRVANADKLHNARAIRADLDLVGDKLWQRFSAPASDQVWYYRSLANTFLERREGRMPRELDAVVSEMERRVGG